MALRLQAATLRDLATNQWTLEIHDSDYVAGTVNFNIAANSLKIKYTGNPSKTYQPLTPSTLSFVFLVENATHETFISDLAGSPEGEFSVKLLKGSNLYWAGNIIMDPVSLEDQYYPYQFSISAVCGLSTLKDVEYWNAGTAYTGSATLLEHLQNVLGKIGTDTHWGVTDDYLITGINWFEDSHSSPDDPLAVTRVSHEVFYKEDDDGQKVHDSCYDVLNHIATALGANLRLSSGAWYFNQVTEYANSTQRRVSYYKAGTQKAVSAATSYDISVDQTKTDAAGSGRYRTNGKFGYTHQLRQVKLVYDNSIPSNLLLNHEWNHVTGSDEYSAGSISMGSGDVSLKFTGTLNVTMDVLASSDIIHLHKFQFVVKVGSYYFHRGSFWNPGSVDPGYNNIFWSTSPGVVDWWTGPLNPDNYITTGGLQNFYNLDIPVEFVTNDILADGSVTIDFVRVDTFDFNTGVVLDFTALNMTYTLYNTALEPQGAGGGSSVNQSTIYIAENPDTDENTRKEEYKTILGDGPNDAYPGHLEVNNGSTWESSDGWQLAGSGTTYAIGDLFVRELMAMQRIPRTLYNGDIIGQAVPTGVNPPTANERVEIRTGEYYFLLTGTLNITEWRWKGTYLLVEKNIVGVTPNDNIIVTADVPIFGGPGSGGSGPPIINDHPPQGTQLVQTGQFNTGFQAAGQVDTLPLSSVNILPGQINEGDTVVIINQVAGASHSFQVAEDHPGGGAPISAYTYLPFDVPSNSIIQVYQPQTTNGQLNTADTIQQVFEEGAASITNASYPGLTVGELYTDEDAGNGSTEGVLIDSEGVRSFDSSSTTPIAWLRSDDEFANFKALVFQSVISELTKEAGLFYNYKGTFPVIADTIATRVIEPISKMFVCVGYNVNVTTAVLTQFWAVGSKWSGYRWGRYKITCQSYGSGSGNNTLKIYKNGVLQITAGFTIPLWTTITIPISMTLLDVFHFEVSSVRATPPKGLIVEMEFIV
jgi:hypothetical protein